MGIPFVAQLLVYGWGYCGQPMRILVRFEQVLDQRAHKNPIPERQHKLCTFDRRYTERILNPAQYHKLIIKIPVCLSGRIFDNRLDILVIYETMKEIPV